MFMQTQTTSFASALKSRQISFSFFHWSLTVFFALFLTTTGVDATDNPDSNAGIVIFSWLDNSDLTDNHVDAPIQTRQDSNSEIVRNVKIKLTESLEKSEISSGTTLYFPRQGKESVAVKISRIWSNQLQAGMSINSAVAADNCFLVGKSADHNKFVWVCAAGKSLAILQDIASQREYRVVYSTEADSYVYQEIDLNQVAEPGGCIVRTVGEDTDPIFAADKSQDNSSSTNVGTDALDYTVIDFSDFQAQPAGKYVQEIIAKQEEEIAQATVTTVIDTLLVYTSKAATVAIQRFGSVELAGAAMVGAMNEALQNSGLGHIGISLKGTILTNYNESNKDYDHHLDSLTGSISGSDAQLFATIRDTERSRYGADLVTLMVEKEYSGTAGIAWMPKTPMSEYGYSVVMVPDFSLDSMLTYAHELGHNFGCDHGTREFQSYSSGTHSYANGFGWYAYDNSNNWTGFASVLTYTGSNYTSRLSYYSNPDIYHLSYSPTGQAYSVATGNSTHNNARKIREGASTIANFVKSGSTIAVTGISLNNTQLNLNFGQNYTLVSTVTPANATLSTVSWSSSNAQAVSVNDGMVIALKDNCQVTITATTIDGNFQASCLVTVSTGNPSEQAVVLTPNVMYSSGFVSSQYGHIYLVDIPATASYVSIRVSSEVGDLDLYVNYPPNNSFPAFGNIDASSTGANSYENIDFTSPVAGQYYINISPYTYVSPMPYDIMVVVEESSNQQVREFVRHFYVSCLNREPEEAGLSAWTELLVNKTITGRDMGYNVMASAEFAQRQLTNAEFVQICYSAFLQRQADSMGLTAWVNLLNNGFPRVGELNIPATNVYDGFALSAEFSQLCANYGIDAF